MVKRIAQARGDLTGDGREETVTLWGARQEGGALWRQVHLTIEDGAHARAERLDLPQNAGYEPKLFLGNMTSRARQDVLVSMDSGGNGGVGLYALYRWDGGRAVVPAAAAQQLGQLMAAGVELGEVEILAHALDRVRRAERLLGVLLGHRPAQRVVAAVV